MIDPASTTAVTDALAAYLDGRGDLDGAALAAPLEPVGTGFDTYIYFFELAGRALPAGWDGPLVLRILPSPAHGERASREAAVQRFIAAAGYPAPAVVAWEDAGTELGLPFIIMQRAPGATMLSRITARPWTMRRHLRSLAGLHARLHAMPIDGAPLQYDRPLVRVRLDAAAREEARRLGLQREFAWLEAHASIVEDEQPVLTHNDFHPLNVLVDPATERMTVIDWSDVRLGDRHHDIARTTVIFWIAAIAAGSAAERIVIGLTRGYMANTYLDAYRAQAPIEPVRLRYWQAFHALHGAAQVLALHIDDNDHTIKQGSRDRVPARLAEDLLGYFHKHAQTRRSRMER